MEKYDSSDFDLKRKLGGIHGGAEGHSNYFTISRLFLKTNINGLQLKAAAGKGVSVGRVEKIEKDLHTM